MIVLLLIAFYSAENLSSNKNASLFHCRTKCGYNIVPSIFGGGGSLQSIISLDLLIKIIKNGNKRPQINFKNIYFMIVLLLMTTYIAENLSFRYKIKR